MGCSDTFLGTEEDPLAGTPQLDIEEVKNAFSELPFKTGNNDFQLEVLHNKKWEFRMVVPEITNDELVPLFVYLHGGALTPNPSAHTQPNCLVDLVLENTKAYVLRLNSSGFLWDDSSNVSQVINLVNFAIENLNIDPERVVVLGYSDGGTGSWFFSDTHPEVFSAGIPMASFYALLYTSEGLVKKTDIPMYVIHGESDTIFPFTNTETQVEKSINAGSDIEFVMAVGLTHFVPCEYQTYLQEGIEWVKNSVWQ
ncbi:MAG: hypothetical protein COA50_02410 [Flavobacteriaceae bacterium]|nr:MAG: hypothetical protein COA50_02410 [Flavobacteriaceae bacterium]